MSRFWQFAQLSDAYKTHHVLDRVPLAGEGALYIGGLKAIDRPDTLEEYRITHIVSVLEDDCCTRPCFTRYQRLWVPVEDHPSQSLLQHIGKTNEFIDEAMASGGNVLVHCAMGVSRSATIVCAYLVYKRMSVLQALSQLQQARPLCAPNTGFMKQLEIYEQMLKASTDEERQQLIDTWSQKPAGTPKL